MSGGTMLRLAALWLIAMAVVYYSLELTSRW